MDNELVYMGNKMIKAEHVWKFGECWFFDKKDEIVSGNWVGGWEKSEWNGRAIYRFVVSNVWD